ncbi:MAG: hypothetical protein ACI4JJ_01080 [Huintestinicola sp.]
MKKSIAAISAAVLAFSLSASVFAADYSKDPGYPGSPSSFNTPDKPSKPSDNSSNNEIPQAGKSFENPAKLITASMVNDAIENGTPIYASYETASMKSSAMAALAKSKGGKLKVVTKRYTVTMDSDFVTEPKDISLAMELTKNTEHGALFVKTEQQDSFGCTLSITIKPKYYNQAEVNIEKARVYRIDNKTKSAEDMGPVSVDKNGNIVFSIKDGGKYVIM